MKKEKRKKGKRVISSHCLRVYLYPPVPFSRGGFSPCVFISQHTNRRVYKKLSVCIAGANRSFIYTPVYYIYTVQNWKGGGVSPRGPDVERLKSNNTPQDVSNFPNYFFVVRCGISRTQTSLNSELSSDTHTGTRFMRSNVVICRGANTFPHS